MKKGIYISDIHLECSNIDQINVEDADFLIIAGDLSAEYQLIDMFFQRKINKEIPIIYVLGNHEYEGKVIQKANQKIKEITKEYKNVHVLNNESVIINGVKFIGSTLWTKYETAKNPKEYEKWLIHNVCDFNSIYYTKTDKTNKLTPQYMKEMYANSLNYIKQELEKPFDGKKIVVTHFPPYEYPVENKNETSAYWENKISEDVICKADYWIHGHWHVSYEKNIGETKLLCNPRGVSKIFNINANANFSYKKKIII